MGKIVLVQKSGDALGIYFEILMMMIFNEIKLLYQVMK